MRAWMAVCTPEMALLNFRKLETWQLFVDDVKLWFKKFGKLSPACLFPLLLSTNPYLKTPARGSVCVLLQSASLSSPSLPWPFIVLSYLQAQSNKRRTHGHTFTFSKCTVDACMSMYICE